MLSDSPSSEMIVIPSGYRMVPIKSDVFVTALVLDFNNSHLVPARYKGFPSVQDRNSIKYRLYMSDARSRAESLSDEHLLEIHKCYNCRMNIPSTYHNFCSSECRHNHDLICSDLGSYNDELIEKRKLLGNKALKIHGKDGWKTIFPKWYRNIIKARRKEEDLFKIACDEEAEKKSIKSDEDIMKKRKKKKDEI